MKIKKINVLLMLMVLGTLSACAQDDAQVTDLSVEIQEEAAKVTANVNGMDIKANKETLDKAQSAMSNKKYATAIAYLTAYIKTKPKKYEGYQLRGECYYELRFYDLAQQDFEKAIELKTEDDKFLTGTKVLGAVVLGADKQSQYQNPELGKLYAQLMYAQKAQNNTAYETSYQKALEYNSHLYLPQPLKKEIAKINCPQKYGKKINTTGIDKDIYDAIDLIEKGQYNEAVYKTQNITSKTPEYYLGHYLTGVAYVGLEKEQEAIAAFEKAIEMNPYDFESMASLGQIYYYDAEKMFDAEYSKKSIEYFEKALVYDPNCYTYHYYIGLNHLQNEELADAISSFNLAIKNNTSDYNSIYYKAIAQYLTGDYDSTIEATTGLLYRHVSNYNSVLYLRALAQYKKENTEAALADIEKIQNNMNDIYNSDLQTVSAKEKTLENYLYYLKAQITEQQGFGAKADIQKATQNPIIEKLAAIKTAAEQYSQAVSDGNVTLEDYNNHKSFYDNKIPQIIGSDLSLTHDEVETQYDYIRTTFDNLGVTFEYENPNYKLSTIKDYTYKKYASKLSKEDSEVLASAMAKKSSESTVREISHVIGPVVNTESLVNTESTIADQLAANNILPKLAEDKEKASIQMKASTDPLDTLADENKTSVAKMLASNMLPKVSSADNTKLDEIVENQLQKEQDAVSDIENDQDETGSDNKVADVKVFPEASKTVTSETLATDTNIAKDIEANTDKVVEIAANTGANSYKFEAEVQKQTDDVKITYSEVTEDTVAKIENVEMNTEDAVSETVSDIQPPQIAEKHAKVDMSEFNIPKMEPEIKAEDEVVYYDPSNVINPTDNQLRQEIQPVDSNSALKTSAAKIVEQTEDAIEDIEDTSDEITEVVAAAPTMITNKLKSVVSSGVEGLPNEVSAPVVASSTEQTVESQTTPVVVVPILKVPVAVDEKPQEILPTTSLETNKNTLATIEQNELKEETPNIVAKVDIEDTKVVKNIEQTIVEPTVSDEIVEDTIIEADSTTTNADENEEKQDISEEAINSIVQSVFLGKEEREPNQQTVIEPEISQVEAEQSDAEIVSVKDETKNIQKEKKSWLDFFKRKKKKVETQVIEETTGTEKAIETIEESISEVENSIDDIQEDADSISTEDKIKEKMKEIVGPPTENIEKNVNSTIKQSDETKNKKKKFIWWWDRDDNNYLEDESSGGEIYGLMKDVYGEEVSKELGLEDAQTPIRTNGQRTLLKEMKK